MAEAPAPTLPELEAALARMVHERYPHAESDDEAELQAMAARDCEYLLTRIRILEAELVEANDEVKWIAPSHRSSPAQALKRIKALCARFPDLFQAMLAVSVTHPAVAKEMLAPAIKQFRRDTDSLSSEDMNGLLVAISNGAQQAFEAVLRTRKNAERKGGGGGGGGVCWVKD
jgi:hypothetical protein